MTCARGAGPGDSYNVLLDSSLDFPRPGCFTREAPTEPWPQQRRTATAAQDGGRECWHARTMGWMGWMGRKVQGRRLTSFVDFRRDRGLVGWFGWLAGTAAWGGGSGSGGLFLWPAWNWGRGGRRLHLGASARVLILANAEIEVGSASGAVHTCRCTVCTYEEESHNCAVRSSV